VTFWGFSPGAAPGGATQVVFTVPPGVGAGSLRLQRGVGGNLTSPEALPGAYSAPSWGAPLPGVPLAPLALFVLWIGLFPATFLGPSAVAVRTAMAPGAAAFAARMGAPHDAPLPQTAQADAATILPGAAIVPSDPLLTAGLERIP
jgi:hypothetical protein